VEKIERKKKGEEIIILAKPYTLKDTLKNTLKNTFKNALKPSARSDCRIWEGPGSRC
jgi:hypothetical protein